MRRTDPAECLRLWRKVRELMAALPEEETRHLRAESCLKILNVGGWRLGLTDAEVTSLYAEGRALAEESGDKRYLARLSMAYAPTVGILEGNIPEYRRLALETEKLAIECGDDDVLASTLVILQYSHLRAGLLQEASRYVERSAELTEQDHDLGKEAIGFGVYTWTYSMGPWTRIYLGDTAGVVAELDKGAALARKEQEIEILGWILGNYALLEFFTGTLGNAELQCVEGLEHSTRLGSPFSTFYSLRSLALTRLNRGRHTEAIEGFEAALRIVEEQRTAREAEAEALSWMALALVGDGRVAEARQAAERALHVVEERGMALTEIDAHFALARAALAEGDADEASKRIDRAAQAAERAGARAWTPLLELERAACARSRGDRAAEQAALRTALEAARDVGAEGHAERAERELATLR